MTPSRMTMTSLLLREGNWSISNSIARPALLVSLPIKVQHEQMRNVTIPTYHSSELVRQAGVEGGFCRYICSQLLTIVPGVRI